MIYNIVDVLPGRCYDDRNEFCGVGQVLLVLLGAVPRPDVHRLTAPRRRLLQLHCVPKTSTF